MSFSSQSGQVGFAKQGAKGTFAPATDWAYLLSTGLGSNADLITSDPEIGGGRDVTSNDIGPISYGGNLEFLFRPEALGHLLIAAIGSVSSTNVCPAAVWDHTITPADDTGWLSIEERVANTYETFGYTDVKVNNFELSMDQGDYVKGSAELIAIKQQADISLTEAVFDDTPKFLWGNVVVKIDDVDMHPRSASFSINNNAEDDDFRLGSLTLGDIALKRRELSVGMTLRPEDSSLYKQAVYGDSSASEPTGAVDDVNVNIVATTYAVIGATTLPYRIEIDIPKANIKPFKVEPSGDDPLENDIEIIPRYDGTNPIVTVTLRNGKASYAAV